jgi:hypothetical protein
VAAERHDAAFIVGAVLGGLAGAAGVLFWAPQAGAQTRAQLGERWRDSTERLTQGIAGLETRARALLGQEDEPGPAPTVAVATPPAGETVSAGTTSETRVVVELEPEPTPPGPRPGPIVGGTVVGDPAPATPAGSDGSGTVPPRPSSGAGTASG